LSEFYINLRKECGQEYEPGTFDSICASIERHLRDNEYWHSLRDTEFSLSTTALQAKKVQLKTRGSQEPVIAYLVFNLTSKVDRKWGCYT
jgi:hypothetical protein